MPLETERICPHCRQPLLPGQETRNAIYGWSRQHIPVSGQVHYPVCYFQLVKPSHMQPQPTTQGA